MVVGGCPGQLPVCTLRLNCLQMAGPFTILTFQAAPAAATAAAGAGGDDGMMDDGMTCGVCFDKPRSVLFMPCRHFAACTDCAARDEVRRKCPWCKLRVTSTIDVFVV